MDLMQDIIARAKADKQRIVLPEGTEERTLKAARPITGRRCSRHYLNWKPR